MSSRYQIKNAREDGSHIATDSHLDRDVVIKPLLSQDAAQAKALIVKLTDLQSKFIADVYDITVGPDRVSIVEEQIEGTDLSRWKESPLSGKSVLRTLFQMTGALTALHSIELSPPSMADQQWRFDSEEILNLSVFEMPGNGPIQRSEARAREDRDRMAQWAIELVSQLDRSSSIFEDTVLQGFLSGDADYDVEAIHRRLHAHLLRDRHRAVLVVGAQRRTSELNSVRRAVKFTHPTPKIASLKIEYDGLEFVVTESSGEAFLNNEKIVAPQRIVGSGVITLGAAERHWSDRHFATFDISNPGVVL